MGEATARRDAQEVQELLLSQTDALYRTARRLTSHQQDAEDLVQETCLKAYRNRKRFKLGTNFRGWIFTILMNTFINRYRRRKRSPRTVDFEQVEHLCQTVDREDGVLELGREEALTEHVSDEVRAAVERLPEEYRSAFLLLSLGGLSYKEIASTLQIEIGTVMSRLHRARKLLQADLLQFSRKQGFPAARKKE